MTAPSLFSDAALGVEPGRRVERVEWGLRVVTADYFRRRGEVTPRADERDVRRVLAAIATGEPLGWGHVEPVSRTVVTYTTRWARQP